MLEFYKNKKVFITGHTGFKGSWLCKIMTTSGANVFGYSLGPPTNPNLFEYAKIGEAMADIKGDVRDLEKLKQSMLNFKPDIVIHMAAQPLVRESYNNPVYTYETNVMGTVNLLEAVRYCDSIRSVLNVTTDKVYKNNEWTWGYREIDELNGYDPYSNSKSCSELVTDSYCRSFLNSRDISVSTVRAGNVIGGGDFAADRIIPDCVRAAQQGKQIIVRNPLSTRPYQHVLEALFAYLLIIKKQYEDRMYAGSYNVGPDDSDCVATGELVKLFCGSWGNLKWINQQNEGVHEAAFLKLDCSKIKYNLQWKPQLNIIDAIKMTVDWYKSYFSGENAAIMENQIKEYEKA